MFDISQNSELFDFIFKFQLFLRDVFISLLQFRNNVMNRNTLFSVTSCETSLFVFQFPRSLFTTKTSLTTRCLQVSL